MTDDCSTHQADGWGPTTTRGRTAGAAAGGPAVGREPPAPEADQSLTYSEALSSYASAGSSVASGPSGGLLEYFHKTVTTTDEDAAVGCLHYRLSICGCNCWFCPDCCGVKGYKLRARLIPVLETFTSTMMVTLTVDPTLFASPLAAYHYIRKRRCVARTMQDLRRAGFLHSGRYFYVVEWQQNTQQVHYHVLCDATYVPWAALLASWSKHRPATAGPIVGDRPAFGTVLISVRRFAGGPVHAARYATKYLVKTPAEGYPDWVLEQGREKRIKRYGVSRGFWGEPDDEFGPTPGEGGGDPDKEKVVRGGRSYAERIEDCGSTYNALAVYEHVHSETGRVTEVSQWVGQLRADEGLLQRIDDGQDVRRRRRDMAARSDQHLMEIVRTVSDGPTYWVRGGHLFDPGKVKA